MIFIKLSDTQYKDENGDIYVTRAGRELSDMLTELAQSENTPVPDIQIMTEAERIQ